MIEFVKSAPDAAPTDWRAEYHAMVDQLVNLVKIERSAYETARSKHRDVNADLAERAWADALQAAANVLHQQAQIEAVMHGLRDLLDKREAK